MREITRKKARKVAHILRDRVFITVNYADVTRCVVYVYPIVGYSANGTTIARFTVYTDRVLSMDIIATYIIENLDVDILRHLTTLSIDSHMIIKQPITNKPIFEHSKVEPWVYTYRDYLPNSLRLVSW